MKICIISDYLPYIHNSWSGAELVSRKTGKILSRMGHEIRYVSLSPDKECPANNISFIKFPFKKLQFLVKNFPIDVVSFFQVFKAIKDFNPDVVHIQAKILFFPSAISASLLGIPYFFTVLDYYNLCPRNILLRKNGELCHYYHGAYCSDCVSQSDRAIVKIINLIFPFFLKKLFFILRKKIVDFFMYKAAKIITFSNTSQERLLAYGYRKDKVAVVYHYSFENIQPDANPAEPVKNNKILFVGAITYHKGLHILVEAMRDVVKGIPEAKLLIAGSGNGAYLNSIHNFISENNLSKNIEFLGHKSNKEVLELMNDVAMVIVPEQWYSEFGPVILIEAKLANKPVVASKIGSIPEYVRDGVDGVLSQHNLPGDFSEAILKVLRGKDMAVMMSQSLSARIEVVKDAKKTFSCLEELYGSAKRSNFGL